MSSSTADKPVASDIVFYDGHCGLCHRGVKFILKRDRRGIFCYAPLQGSTFSQRVSAEQRQNLPDSIIVLTRDGRLLARSSAAVHILLRLGLLWPVVGGVLWIIPRPVRNWAYDAIARRRGRFFKRPEQTCPLMPEELRGRFLE
jgi:predicted DCC family thiol-disulfide oxidoreductase YuxK